MLRSVIFGHGALVIYARGRGLNTHIVTNARRQLDLFFWRYVYGMYHGKSP